MAIKKNVVDLRTLCRCSIVTHSRMVFKRLIINITTFSNSRTSSAEKDGSEAAAVVVVVAIDASGPLHACCLLTSILFVTINVNLSLCCRHEGACSPLSCTSSNTLCVVRCHVRVIVYMFRILLKQRRQNKKNNRMASHSSLYSRARGVCLLIRYCHLLAVATAHRSKIYIIHNLKLKIIC